MKTKMYDYWVSAKYTADGYLTPCSLTMGISRKKKIKTFDDIREVTKCIQDNMEGYSNVKNLSIDNIIFLGRNKH